MLTTAFAWNFRYFGASIRAKRFKGCHSLIARLLTLRTANRFSGYRLNKDPSIQRTNPTKSAGPVAGGNPPPHFRKRGRGFQSILGTEGMGNKLRGYDTSGKSSTHCTLVLVVSYILNSSDVDNVDPLLLSR